MGTSTFLGSSPTTFFGVPGHISGPVIWSFSIGMGVFEQNFNVTILKCHKRVTGY